MLLDSTRARVGVGAKQKERARPVCVGLGNFTTPLPLRPPGYPGYRDFNCKRAETGIKAGYQP